MSSYYGYRTSRVQAHLDELQKSRDTTIEKLKAATKYNSTQELLKKYGGTPTPNAKSEQGPDRKKSSKQSGPRPSPDPRTSFVPPPTANIPRTNGPVALQSPPPQYTPPTMSPINQPGSRFPTFGPQSSQRPRFASDASAEFAPNAFPSAPQYSRGDEGSKWYDRIMDVLLGEDENRPGARLALICAECRLVNGQAPPGVKTLEDLGKWRCGGCGAMNGEDSVAKKIVASINDQTSSEGDGGRSRRESRREEPEPMAPNRRKESSIAPADKDHETDVTSSNSSEDDQDRRNSEDVALEPSEEPVGPRRRSKRATKGKMNTG